MDGRRGGKYSGLMFFGGVEGEGSGVEEGEVPRSHGEGGSGGRNTVRSNASSGTAPPLPLTDRHACENITFLQLR